MSAFFVAADCNTACYTVYILKKIRLIFEVIFTEPFSDISPYI